MSIQTFKPVKEGKVREVYDIGDSLIITATDRISAFDVILKNKVEKKWIKWVSISLATSLVHFCYFTPISLFGGFLSINIHQIPRHKLPLSLYHFVCNFLFISKIVYSFASSESH